MGSAKGKVVISTEVPVEMRGELDDRAAAEGRSRAAVMLRALRFYLRHAPVVRSDDVPDPAEKGRRK